MGGHTEDVAIIGAGPAGLTAALQLQRSGISPLVLERSRIGGLLHNANLVENYPGFPGGITGPKLVQLFEDQARRIGVRVALEEVVDLTYDGGTFQVTTSVRTYRSPVAIIASGTKARMLAELPIPESLRDRVHYEVHPLLNAEEKRVVIVGAGDAAFDYALNLARKNDVLILNRTSRVRCLPLLWERAEACPRITYHPKTDLSKVEYTSHGGIELECTAPAGAMSIHADYLVAAIGREPELDFVSPSLVEQVSRLEKRGVLHLIGDVKSGIFRQTAIAVGDGMLAAMKIHRFLQNSGVPVAEAGDGDQTARQSAHRETAK